LIEKRANTREPAGEGKRELLPPLRNPGQIVCFFRERYELISSSRSCETCSLHKQGISPFFAAELGHFIVNICFLCVTNTYQLTFSAELGNPAP